MAGPLTGLRVLDIATIHEFGAPAAGIPQRSFVRATVDEHRADIARIQRALAARVERAPRAPSPRLLPSAAGCPWPCCCGRG